jgi:hypothetical protein
MPMGVLAMLTSCDSVLLRLLMLAMRIVVRGLKMVVSGCVMAGRGLVMMLNRHVFASRSASRCGTR